MVVTSAPPLYIECDGQSKIKLYSIYSVTLHTFLISQTHSSVLPGKAILEELVLRIGLAAWAIFSRIAQ